MKRRHASLRTVTIHAVALLMLASGSTARSQNGPAPELLYAFSAQVEVALPLEQGEIDGARKRFVPITGGTVSGPRLTGTVMSGGGDWQTIRTGGLTEIEARYYLHSADGAVIGIHNAGVRVASPEVTDRIARGERVESDMYYFRTVATFDPPPGTYEWMRTKVFIARGIRMPDHVIIDFYTVE